MEEEESDMGGVWVAGWSEGCDSEPLPLEIQQNLEGTCFADLNDHRGVKSWITPLCAECDSFSLQDRFRAFSLTVLAILSISA